MECFECGKPYMAGLEFRMDGNILRFLSCHNNVVEARKKSFANKIIEQRKSYRGYCSEL